MKILIVIVLYKQSLNESFAYTSLSQIPSEVFFEYKFYIHDNSPFKTNVTEENTKSI
jgi:hypothetical protein